MAKTKCFICKFENVLREFEKHPNIGSFYALKPIACEIFNGETGEFRYDNVAHYMLGGGICPFHDTTEMVSAYIVDNAPRIEAALFKQHIFKIEKFQVFSVKKRS